MHRYNLIIFSALVFSLPLGVAAQNAIVFLVFILSLKSPRHSGITIPKGIILAPLALTLWTIAATIFNPANPETKPYEYFFGYLPLFLMPWLLLPRIKWQSFYKDKLLFLANMIAVAWVSIVISQYIWGWSLNHLEGGLKFRPQGFFSHPLTLSYIVLLLWPWALHYLTIAPRQWKRWILPSSIFIILILTQSRACQGIAYTLLLWVVLTKTSGPRRWTILIAIGLLSSLILITENPISSRFYDLFSDSNPDRFSHYPDDRLAFWDAHWQMIKERPIFGHGMHLHYAYRKPYYELIGLKDFLKQYEAHNQYLQIWANSGLIGLLVFLYWLGCLIRYGSSLGKASEPWLQMIFVFIVGAVVQNAFSDSEVRNTLMVIICLASMIFRQQENTGDLAVSKKTMD